ncbi:hypothetical protein QC761_0092050 [Podospora bellae-mahoneyi]|uniref:Uncharacterized protein n=1 Tax=Podospora bellae-mahoneyi TaxID=2093777 RepID=A0ABR0F9R0_9PEZI|nr:hypothetical protein QC761_0092050 [Podospora bellae-mahoneyi]
MYLTGNEAECHPDIVFPNEKQGAVSGITASLASRRRFNREGVCDDENSPVGDEKPNVEAVQDSGGAVTASLFVF